VTFGIREITRRSYWYEYEEDDSPRDVNISETYYESADRTRRIYTITRDQLQWQVADREWRGETDDAPYSGNQLEILIGTFTYAELHPFRAKVAVYGSYPKTLTLPSVSINDSSPPSIRDVTLSLELDGSYTQGAETAELNIKLIPPTGYEEAIVTFRFTGLTSGEIAQYQYRETNAFHY
jgi:hypothetical protein